MHLKHLLAPSLLASALLLSAGHALAGADLSVTGKIERAGTCSLALGNGGTIDLGTISRKDLKEAEAARFDRYISLDIRCQAPTKVGYRMLDNRAGTSTSSYEWAYGLGASGGKNVGWAELGIDKSNNGGNAWLYILHNSPGSDAWDVSQAWAMRPSWLYSWAKEGHLPQAFQNISGMLGVSVWIAPTKDLDLSQEIAIDGSATMELVYL